MHSFLPQELECYQDGLSLRPTVLVVNKMDLPSAKEKLHSLLSVLQGKDHFFSIVPATAQLGVGVAIVTDALVRTLQYTSQQ